MRQLASNKPPHPGRDAQNHLSTSPDESFDAVTNGRPKDSTRTRHACESCRLLKVRCLSNANQSISKCQRCARLNQECLMKARAPRKPRKRTDTRVEELERQVDALRAAFGTPPSSNGSALASARSKTSTTLTHNQEHAMAPEPDTFRKASLPSPPAELRILVAPCGAILHGSPPQCIISPSASVSSGSLTPSIACDLFETYQTELVQYLPLSSFLDTDDASTARERNPTLFLAVITAAAGYSDLELHSTLIDQLTQDLAKRTVIDGERSIELVQALLITAAFYQPPGASEKLKNYQFIQYIHMAVTMSNEIGLENFGGAVGPHGYREYLTVYCADEERNASRRTAIACYIICLS